MHAVLTKCVCTRSSLTRARTIVHGGCVSDVVHALCGGQLRLPGVDNKLQVGELLLLLSRSEIHYQEHEGRRRREHSIERRILVGDVSNKSYYPATFQVLFKHGVSQAAWKSAGGKHTGSAATMLYGGAAGAHRASRFAQCRICCLCSFN